MKEEKPSSILMMILIYRTNLVNNYFFQPFYFPDSPTWDSLRMQAGLIKQV